MPKKRNMKIFAILILLAMTISIALIYLWPARLTIVINETGEVHFKGACFPYIVTHWMYDSNHWIEEVNATISYCWWGT